MFRFILHTIVFLFCTQTVWAQKGPESWSGTASFYHSKFEGRRTASGDRFSNTLMTAASNRFKLGQTLRVTNLNNGQSVIVVVNDRMAEGSKRIIDLTQSGAKKLCFLNQGLCQVKIEIVDPSEMEDSRVENRETDSVSSK